MAVDAVRRVESCTLAAEGRRDVEGHDVRVGLDSRELYAKSMTCLRCFRCLRCLAGEHLTIGAGLGYQGKPAPPVGLHIMWAQAHTSFKRSYWWATQHAARLDHQGGADAEGASREHLDLSRASDHQRRDGRPQRRDSANQVRRSRLSERRITQDEPPRDCRRLPIVRGWEHGKTNTGILLR